MSDGIESVKDELQTVKQEIAKMQVREDKVDELRAWKEKVDEVASPSQLSALIKEVESLKLFKIKAITVFAVVQFGMALVLFLEKMF